MDLDFLQSMMAGEEVEAVSTGYQDIWVVGETAAGELTPLTMAVTGKARELANALGAYVKGFLFGPERQGAGEQMIHFGADSVTLFEDLDPDYFCLEPFSDALAGRIEGGRPEIVLFGSTSLAGELAPRLAARFSGPLFTHCIDLSVDEMKRALMATVPRLGGEYFEVLVSPAARPQFATVASGALPNPFADNYRFGDIETVVGLELPVGSVKPLGPAAGLSAEQTLKGAQVIVCLGRGLVDEEGVALAKKLARNLNAALAGSRGALDEGWVSADQVIGLGGVRVRPQLYIGCGVAGAIQHVAGMERAGFVVAINADPGAEFFSIADMAVVGDAKEILGVLNEILFPE